MPEPPSAALRGKVILIVEDEYLLASDLEQLLQHHGATVAGPVGSVLDALALVKRENDRLDAAVLDVNLRGERVYPVADTLIERGVPIVFTTGYDEMLVAKRYIGMPRCQKPIDKAALFRMLVQALGN
jgi:CheY-like chemotaxis protein